MKAITKKTQTEMINEVYNEMSKRLNTLTKEGKTMLLEDLVKFIQTY